MKNLIEITRDAKRCWCILFEDNDRPKVLAKTTGRMINFDTISTVIPRVFPPRLTFLILLNFYLLFVTR